MGVPTSFPIPFMGARLPDVQTHASRSRLTYKSRKPLSTTAKYLDPRKRLPEAPFPGRDVPDGPKDHISDTVLI